MPKIEDYDRVAELLRSRIGEWAYVCGWSGAVAYAAAGTLGKPTHYEKPWNVSAASPTLWSLADGQGHAPVFLIDEFSFWRALNDRRSALQQYAGVAHHRLFPPATTWPI